MFPFYFISDITYQITNLEKVSVWDLAPIPDVENGLRSLMSPDLLVAAVCVCWCVCVFTRVCLPLTEPHGGPADVGCV